MLGGLADWRSRTLELWQWRQGDFQATNGCIFSMCQPYSSMLLNAASSQSAPSFRRAAQAPASLASLGSGASASSSGSSDS